jgi:hypothetical protein
MRPLHLVVEDFPNYSAMALPARVYTTAAGLIVRPGHCPLRRTGIPESSRHAACLRLFAPSWLSSSYLMSQYYSGEPARDIAQKENNWDRPQLLPVGQQRV